MISKEAEAAIRMLACERDERNQTRKTQDPIAPDIEGIFKERESTDARARNLPLPDKLTLAYEYADGVHGEWLRYLDTDPAKLRNRVILFVHGWGFNSGSALSRRALAAKLSLCAKVDSFSINYRRCPEYRFPAPVEDCVTAYLWLLKKGYDPKEIVLFGESAGGNLVLAMTHFLQDHYFPLPGGVCAFSPVVEQTSCLDSRILRANRDVMLGMPMGDDQAPKMLELFRSDRISISPLYCTAEEGASPYASPMRGDFTGFPKLMVQVGTEEMLYDDAVELVKKATAAGVTATLHIWEGLFHVFALFDLPETALVCDEIGQFIRGV